jgi:hypothetical protein
MNNALSFQNVKPFVSVIGFYIVFTRRANVHSCALKGSKRNWHNEVNHGQGWGDPTPPA